jgi:hypothetical protein
MNFYSSFFVRKIPPLSSLSLRDLSVNQLLVFNSPAVFDILKITRGYRDYAAVVIDHFDLAGNHV